MKEKMVKITITLPVWAINEIDRLRKPLKLSRSKFVAKIVEARIEAEKNKNT